MKFTCEKYLLQNAIATAARAAAPKSPIPALEGLLIEAGSQVRITGYDLKKGIYTAFPADVAQPGSIVLGAGSSARSSAVCPTALSPCRWMGKNGW